MTRDVSRAELAAEQQIYVGLGQALLEMLHPEHQELWTEVLLHVEHVVLPEAPEAYVMETVVVLQGGERLPLAARPRIMSLARDLDRLCKEQSGRAWRAFDYRLFRNQQGGAAFQCRYTYPDTRH